MNTTRQREDDQYVAPLEASRRGAHRARVSPVLAALPFVAVAVVVVGVVALAWTLFGGSGGDDQSAGAISSAAPQSTASRSAQPSSSASSQAAPSTSSEPAAEQTSQSASTTTKAASTVDKSQPIVVRNSTRTGGLAAGAATKLKNRGWSINGTPDNYRPAIPSTVFYAEDAQKASAQAVAKILRIDIVKKDPGTATKGITVILGSDYQR